MAKFDVFLKKIKDDSEISGIDSRLNVVEETVNIVVAGGTPFNGSFSCGDWDDGTSITISAWTAE